MSLLTLMLATQLHATDVLMPRDTVVAEREGIELTINDFDASIAYIPVVDRWNFINDQNRLGNHLSGAVVNMQLARDANNELTPDQLAALEPEFTLLRKRVLFASYQRYLGSTIDKSEIEPLARQLFEQDGPHRLVVEKRKVEQIVVRGPDAKAQAEALLKEARNGRPLAEMAQPLKANEVPGNLFYDQSTYAHRTNLGENPVLTAVFAVDAPGLIDQVISLPEAEIIIAVTDIQPSRLETFEDKPDKYMKQARKQLLERQYNMMLVRNGISPENDLAELDLVADVAEQQGLFDEWSQNWLRYEKLQALAKHYLTIKSQVDPESVEALARESYLLNKSEYIKPPTIGLRMVQFDQGSEVDQAARSGAPQQRDLEQWLTSLPPDAYRLKQISERPVAELPTDIKGAVEGLTTIGAISNVIENGDQAAFFEVTSYSPERQQTFDEVADQITATVQSNQTQEIRKLLISEKRDMEATLNHAAIDSLLQRYHVDNFEQLHDQYNGAKSMLFAPIER